MVSGIIGNDVPRKGLRVRVPCPPPTGCCTLVQHPVFFGKRDPAFRARCFLHRISAPYCSDFPPSISSKILPPKPNPHAMMPHK